MRSVEKSRGMIGTRCEMRVIDNGKAERNDVQDPDTLYNCAAKTKYHKLRERL